MAMVWHERKRTILAIITISSILAAATFAFSGVNALIIDELIGIAGTGSWPIRLTWLVVALIAIYFIRPSLRAFERYYSRVFWFFLEERFERDISVKYSQLDIAVLENPRHNDLLQRVNEEGAHRARSFVDSMIILFEALIGLALASSIIFTFQWWLLGIIIIGLVPGLLAGVRLGEFTWSIYNSKGETKRRYRNLQGHLSRVSDLVEVKLLANAKYFLSTIMELFESFQKEQRQLEQRRLRLSIATELAEQVSLAIVVSWFIWQVVHGSLSIGTFTFGIAAVTQLQSALYSVTFTLTRQYNNNLFITDLFEFLDITPLLAKPEPGHTLSVSSTPRIVFDNITFSYPGTSRTVLRNFSLTIEPGERLALIGINGAGKTTIVKLLLRFYDPDKGSITVDDVDLRHINLESWYQLLGVLFQDYSHYHMIVRDAIALGRSGKHAPLEKVKEAAKAGEADAFIEEWEKRYSQMLGREFSSGVEPSVGQWQKLALARTFYRDPRILILDEPTASIDAEAEKKIFDRIESMPSDRSAILISHRFSTVRKANKIAVVKNGRLAEYGSHEDLMALNGTYARLFRLQAKEYH